MSETLKFEQRIFYVGQHNKPHMKPLDSRTKSGKIVDRLVGMCKDDSITHVKTNLYDTLFWPDKDMIDPERDVRLWQYRHLQTDDDVIVSLGIKVTDIFKKAGVKTIHIPHPASIYSCLRLREYLDLANEIIGVAAAHAVSRDAETARRYLEANGEDVDRIVADGMKLVRELIEKAKAKQK